MRLRDHTSGGPLGLVSVSVANWSTRIPRRAPESHIHWTESRGTLNTHILEAARGLAHQVAAEPSASVGFYKVLNPTIANSKAS